MIKRFTPKPTPNPGDEEQLIALLRKGEFNPALKIAKKLSLLIEDYPLELDRGAHKLLISRRASELMSFMHDYPALIKIDILEVLQAAYEYRDFHGFLKNCIRFDVGPDLSVQIKDALTRIRAEEALAWQKKFQRLGLF